MAPISKENEVLTSAPDSTTPAPTSAGARQEDTASRPQPVALEIPVTVNGARTIEGSDKREPFSETTKTVLVFGNGAVIRLGSPVAAGQLLFLTNEKTKKEVVCQVVKSKNYRSVSGYVELEFTESVVGFWGMRFPTDRISAPAPTPIPAAPPVSKANPVAPVAPVATIPKVAAPAVHPVPKIPEVKASPVPAEVKPAAVVPVAPPPPAPKVVVAPAAASIAPPAPKIEVPLAPRASAPVVPVAKAPEPPTVQAVPLSASLASSLASLLDSPAAGPEPVAPKLAVPGFVLPEAKPVQPASSRETEELKLQAARLQEQLSSLLFSAAPAATPVPPAPPAAVQEFKAAPNVAAKVLEIAKAEPVLPKPVAPVKTATPAVKSSLDTEEVKIPSWLEPLARNAAAPASTQELIEREKAKHAADHAAQTEHAPEAAAIAEVENASTPELPAFGSLLQLEEGPAGGEHQSEGSNKIFMIAVVAAVILLVAGGGWYLFHPTSAVQGKSPAIARSSGAATQPSPATPEPLAVQPVSPAQPSPKTSLNTPEPVSAPSTSQPAPAATVSKPPVIAQPAPVTRETTHSVAATPATPVPAAEKERIAHEAEPQPEPEQPKKPMIGEVHLASPTVNRPAATQEDAQAPTLATGADVPNVGGLDAGLAAGGNKPAVPLPVGGDVKSAQLISKVDPVYPSIARSQRVSGSVVIDALIDAKGNVTTMKVLSGPTLLHQAAMEALKQWKYRPATLDGNPVSMHLTVSIQFRIP
jgi:periplasmic protein TonB